jgi:hypothetical protein
MWTCLPSLLRSLSLSLNPPGEEDEKREEAEEDAPFSPLRCELHDHANDEAQVGRACLCGVCIRVWGEGVCVCWFVSERVCGGEESVYMRGGGENTSTNKQTNKQTTQHNTTKQTKQTKYVRVSYPPDRRWWWRT